MKKFSDYNIKKPTNCNFKNFVSKIYGNLCTHGALRSSFEDWRMMRDRGELVAVVSMDLSKAFDVIQYPLLLSKLRAYGKRLPGKASSVGSRRGVC